MTYRVQPQNLESFGRAPFFLIAALRQFPKKMWLFEPGPGRWSIHKTILHLADTEASTYLCCRRYIAEQGSLGLQIDSGRWAESLGYCHQSTRDALEIIRRLRKATFNLLFTLQQAPKTTTLEHHRDHGLSLDEWLEHLHRHLLRHILQMRKNYELWLRTHPPRKPASSSKRSNAPSSTIVPTLGN
jgi:DinB superfamily